MKNILFYCLVVFMFASCAVLQQLHILTPNIDFIKKKKKAIPSVVISVPVVEVNSVAVIIGKDSITSKILQSELALALDTLNKNNPDAIKTVLEEYINSKTLLLESEKAGYTKEESYIQEIESYRSVLSQAYLTDSTMIKSMVKETYKWLQEEILASHILLTLPEYASPADTTEIYDKAMALRQRILNGEDFPTLARQISADRKTASNGGSLGYFTALQITYPFESAAYNTALGEISSPVRSKYGYHLIKVFDRRPTLGKLKIAHIMLVSNSKMSEFNKQQAKTKIEESYQKLQSGANFEDLCKQYSEDLNSKNKNGVLPIFGVGKYDEIFENKAFALKNNGDYTEPFLSNSGWHILKLIDKISLESFEALEPSLNEKIVTDSRGEIVKENTLNKIKRDFNFSENSSIFPEIYTRLDTTLLKKKWHYSDNDNILTKPIFSIENKTYTVKEFFDFMVENQKNIKITQTSTSTTITNQLYKQFVSEEVRLFAENNMEKKVPEFVALMNEYKTGVLSSRILTDRVYTKSTQDTTGQRLFYESNKHNYLLPERVNATIIECPDSKFFYQIKEVIGKSVPYPLKVKLKNDLFFSQNESKLNYEQEKNLIGLIATMKKNKNYIAEIGAYADVAENDSISGSRLRNVVTFLTRNGLELPRIIENDYVRTKQLNADASKNRKIAVQFLSNSKEDVARIFNQKNPNAVKITEKSYEKGELALLDSLKWEAGIKRFDLKDKIIEVHINHIEAPRYKTLKECRGLVIKGFQNQLKMNLQADLRRKYPIQVNDEEVNKIINK